jgi:hypothetical protein
MAKRDIPQRLIPLNEAPWYFAPQRLKRELDRVRSLPSQPVPVRKAEDGLEAFLVLVRGFQALSDDLRKRNEPIWEMQEILRQRLSAGKLDAFGIKTKPELGNKPQQIPPFIFKDKPKISWGENTVENFGQRFEGVEVGRPAQPIATLPSTESDENGPPSMAPELVHGSRKNEEPRVNILRSRKPGRPLAVGFVVAVAQEAKDEGAFEGKYEKEIVALVQERARKRHPKAFPKPSQPSPSTVRKALRLIGE